MIEELVLKIRRKAIKRFKKKSAEDLATTWSQEDLLYSGKGKAIFMILPTWGCSWALSESGGCTMCSYISDSLLEHINPNTLIKIFKDLISRHKIKEKTAVKIFTSGSFLNPHEFPPDARNFILEYLNNIKEVEEIVIESRPEYVKKDVLMECCPRIPNKILEVSIGLETADDYIRKYKINKGFRRKDFEKAIQIIKDLKRDFKIKSKVYILVKPILTSEKEAIEDAIKSAIYAEDMGIDRISFCPSTIHRGTLMEELWKRGSYRPPWIWSLVEIINTTREQLNIPSIMDTSGFGTPRGPYNCKKCNSRLKKLIIESNLSQKPVPWIKCDCYRRWVAEKESGDFTRSANTIKYQTYYEGNPISRRS